MEMPTTRIHVSEELGDKVVTREHGKKLAALIEEGLTDPPVIVDFDGLQITSVSFFDEAFGQLALRYGAGFPEKIEFARIDPFDRALVNDIVRSRLRQQVKRRTAS